MQGDREANTPEKYADQMYHLFVSGILCIAKLILLGLLFRG